MNQNASRLKLLAACIYELLLLLALWMLCTWVFVRLFGDATTGFKHTVLQLLLWLVAGAYFVWCWVKSGQTLATKTWKIKLVNQDLVNEGLVNQNLISQQNITLSPQQAVVRYALASLLMLACGLTLFWMLVDKDRLFLHDRLLKTRFISLV